MKKSGLDKYKAKLAKAEEKHNKKLEKLSRKAGIIVEIEEINKLFEDLKNKKISAADKAAKIDQIWKLVKKAQEKNIKFVSKKTGIEASELSSLSDVDTKISDLTDELDTIEAKDEKDLTKDDKKQAKKLKKQIEWLNKLREAITNETTVKGYLNKYISSTTKSSEKAKITKSFKEFLKKNEDLLKEVKKRDNLKDATKEKLDQTSAYLKANGKKVGLVTGSIILAIVMLLVAYGFIKNHNDKNKGNNNNDTELIDTESQYHNLYLEVSEKYNVDYETAKALVDRAVAIRETGFFDPNEFGVYDTIDVIDAVDSKTINTQESFTQDQAINATLTDIYNNYMYGTITNDDLQKIDALMHFAKQDSELDKFLTTYLTLLKNILVNQKNEQESIKAKNEMYEFLNVFANSYTGYIPTDSDLSASSVNSYQSAVLGNTQDWNIVYNTFVKPMMSAFITEENANDYGCIQITMLSNYEQWVQLNCTEDVTLTLGK